jgi:xanthine dehydrogenase accessory factor
MCALVTIAATTGSVPRQVGSKMLVYADGHISGTIGGGKFEALVVQDSLQSMATREPLLKRYPLREDQPDSFGAVCGGEVTVLIEPQKAADRLIIIGAGHCARAIASLALQCGMPVTVVEDRAETVETFPEQVVPFTGSTSQFFAARRCQPDDTVVLVSRNHELDREALAALLNNRHTGYIGMIGSRRKVLRVFDDLRKSGGNVAGLDAIYAPIGLDIGADSPAEIAVSVMAEILQVRRHRKGGHLRLGSTTGNAM